MSQRSSFGIAKRLYLVSGLIIAALVVLAVYARFSLTDIGESADFTRDNRVPQLNAFADFELSVAQVTGLMRHAILARNDQELGAALNSIQDKQKLMDETLAAYEKRLFSPSGKEHFKSMPPLFADFGRQLPPTLP